MALALGQIRRQGGVGGVAGHVETHIEALAVARVLGHLAGLLVRGGIPAGVVDRGIQAEGVAALEHAPVVVRLSALVDEHGGLVVKEGQHPGVLAHREVVEQVVVALGGEGHLQALRAYTGLGAPGVTLGKELLGAYVVEVIVRVGRLALNEPRRTCRRGLCPHIGIHCPGCTDASQHQCTHHE